MAAELRRDLGTLESYAALIGILIGAGIFRVTSDAWQETGPSVLLAHALLAPAVLATSVAYAVFLSTPLGREPGGEYAHIARTFGGHRIAFVGAWLKIVAYCGAGAFLAQVLADYLIELGRVLTPGEFEGWNRPLAVGCLAFFFLVHLGGVRWFGRLQVGMCLVLGVSLVVLVLPGLFAIRVENYRPFLTDGPAGLARALPPVFFAYAGFESLAQAAGEVKDSTKRLPRVFLRGLLATSVVYILMSAVTFGVLPSEKLSGSTTPMADVAAVFLPAGAVVLVTLGAVFAVATSLNATFLVPSRLGVMLARDRLAPRFVGWIDPRTGAPLIGLVASFAFATALLLSGQLELALDIAVFALVILYFLHSLALLLLPRANPDLYRSARTNLPRGLQVAAALTSMAAMGVLIAVQVVQDLRALGDEGLTSLELVGLWGLLGAVLLGLGRLTAR